MVETGGVISAARARAALLAVGFAVFVAADDLTVVTTMLRPMINDLGVVLPDGLDDAAWVVNAYLIAFVAVMPLAGRASDRFGRRRSLLVAYGVFVAGTIVIASSNSLGPLLIGRILTALGGGAMVPVALAVVGDVNFGAQRTRALGILGAIETFGWVWGPLYGALLIRFAGWRWQFWLNVPLSIVGVILVARFVPDRPESATRRPTVGWIGPVLLAGFLASLSLALLANSEIQSVQGLDELRGTRQMSSLWFWLATAVTGIGFVAHERASSTPVIERSWLRQRPVLAALLVNFLVGAALVVAMVDIPIVVNALVIDVKRAAVLAGWVLASLTAAMTLGSWLGGRWATKPTRFHAVPNGVAAVIGGELLTVGALAALGFTMAPAMSWWIIAVELAVLGLGLGLVFAPSTDAVVDAASDQLRGSAASVVMVVRLIGLSVGLAAMTAWALERFNSRRADIALPPLTDPGFQDAVLEATATLTTEAVADTFLVAAALVLVGAVLTTVLVYGSSSDSNVSLAPTNLDRSQGNSSMTQTSSADYSGENSARWWRAVALASLGLVLIAAIAIALSWQQQRSQVAVLTERVDALQTEIDRVEQGAAGSAIVASQVLELTDRLAEIQPTIASGLDEAIGELEDFGSSSLEFSVPIDETVIIDTTIDLKRDFSFPIDESLPIDETVRTTIEVDTGLGFKVPVDVTVPVKLDVPIDLDVDVPIDETVPIKAEVPVNLDVPIKINMADTELSLLAEQLADGLRNVSDLLGELRFDN